MVLRLHGPEFYQGERLTVFANSSLPEQDRAGRSQSYSCRGNDY
jgi:hypothetical protein